MGEEDTEMGEEKFPEIKKAEDFIFFGSLENEERKRVEALKVDAKKEVEKETEEDEGKEGIVIEMPAKGDGDAEMAAENEGEEDEMEVEVPPGTEAVEREQGPTKAEPSFFLSEESQRAKEKQEAKMREFLMKRRARALVVPTKDDVVRERLRALGEPMTFFGEREMERRERLRMLMAKMDAAGEMDKLMQAIQPKPGEEEEEEEEEEVPQDQPFHTEGPEALFHVRRAIALSSLRAAKARVAAQRRRREDPDEDEDMEAHAVLAAAAKFTMECSEIGDDRPLSCCATSPDGSCIVTGSWNGIAKVWSLGPGPSINMIHVLKGHTERLTGLAFQVPKVHVSADSGSIATASADTTARLWSLNGTCVRTFSGHLDRLGRLAFHPSGLYLGTASFDKTWRLWDVETGNELLLQEGHSRSVYSVAFQIDGSLAASCGLDALARVWDLRTGRSLLTLEGHVKPVLAVDFSPNGYHVATGSEDHTCRIWDLRKRKCIYIIPAHSSLISQVRYEPSDGHFLVTSSFDNTVRVWSSHDFKPVKSLAGHEGKVMDVSVSPESEFVTTVSYDRTVKLWVQSSI